MKPLVPNEKWWERPECWRGEVARGFDFHSMGLPRGRHVLKKDPKRPEPVQESVQEELLDDGRQ